MLDSDQGKLGLKCITCGNTEHFTSRCPWVSHRPNTDIIIRRYLYSKRIPRRKYFRRTPLKSTNSLKNIKLIREGCVPFEKSMSFFTQEEESSELVSDIQGKQTEKSEVGKQTEKSEVFSKETSPKKSLFFISSISSL